MPRILYLVPNLSDPAVSRRVAMFRLGGAEVDIAGFRRADAPPADLPLANVVELDITHDARMLQRLFATLRAGSRAKGWAKGFARPDVIVARNLEMLVVANRLLPIWPDAPALVYECLDIHRLMLRQDGIGGAMRATERRLMRQADWLVTSSPAFVANHFASQSPPPVMLVENKVFAPDLVETGRNPGLAGETQRIQIGWFGALRCNKSLAALQGLAEAFAGGIEVTLRGRPALTEFADFHGTVTAARHLTYGGAYAYPDDLASLYSAIHFVWAVDLFEEGQNSSWLLPNRLYEGCLNGAIPIALQGTEMAAYIERLGIGVIVPDIEHQTLVALFSGMTPERLRALAEAVAQLDQRLFRCTEAECRQLVGRLIDAPVDSPALEAAE
ncbi:glycosyl transferase family 1 [Devosia ginsengisoli]|uniref:glycosyl transferase family 1 n=1 Tax=Devosia ginsengisoli TaxID=400770 RepID=UPI0016453FD4|nr:glycosyl transferase family 1 [Devosia ginsengisoli]